MEYNGCAGTYAESCEVVAKAKLKELKEAGFEESKLIYEGRFIRAVVGEFESNKKADTAMKKLDDKNISVHILMSQS